MLTFIQNAIVGVFVTLVMLAFAYFLLFTVGLVVLLIPVAIIAWLMNGSVNHRS